MTHHRLVLPLRRVVPDVQIHHRAIRAPGTVARSACRLRGRARTTGPAARSMGDRPSKGPTDPEMRRATRSEGPDARRAPVPLDPVSAKTNNSTSTARSDISPHPGPPRSTAAVWGSRCNPPLAFFGATAAALDRWYEGGERGVRPTGSHPPAPPRAGPLVGCVVGRAGLPAAGRPRRTTTRHAVLHHVLSCQPGATG